MSAVAALARLYPWPVEPTDELRRAVRFLDISTEPSTLLSAAYGVALVGAATTAVAAVLAPPETRLLVTLALGTLTAVVAVGTQSLPSLLATARRVRALGDAPDLVARAVLRMRLAPSPERAAAFAASAGDGPLADSLARHVRQARTATSTAFDSFGDEWKPWFPSLARSLTLVSAASEMSTVDRERTLERALTVVLDGTRSQMQSFASGLNRPVTALYAFGVLLPTALVALLPAAHAVGVGITTTTVALVYNLLLPALLLAAACWLLAYRPVAFPPPNVSRDHPDVPDRATVALVATLAAALAGATLTWQTFPSWTIPVAAIGFGVGSGLLVYHRPVLAVYDHVRAVETELTDALSVVGRRVANGEAVESAIEQAGRELSGEMGTLLAQTARKQRQLQLSVHEAFLGDTGSLADVPSRRVSGAVAFLALAAREGKPAGPAILSLADHIDELGRVEAEARHTLQPVCGTLQSTGMLFGPLVAGSTVALAGGMVGGSGVVPGEGGSLPYLGLSIGLYALTLATILPALSTALVRGFDRVLVGARVGKSLLIATIVYLAAYQFVVAIA
ncbi:type II secretion system protein [Salinibaculum salinum]|uniref:type II secretion system protein n=1 Tax=Salinibaculum salinum TaxID=3131996 RepID=UPI0030EE4A5E